MTLVVVELLIVIYHYCGVASVVTDTAVAKVFVVVVVVLDVVVVSRELLKSSQLYLGYDLKLCLSF